jgi:hypothetical protein
MAFPVSRTAAPGASPVAANGNVSIELLEHAAASPPINLGAAVQDGDTALGDSVSIFISKLPRLGRLYKAAIDIYTRPPNPPGCIVVGTATVESPSHPRIGAAANEILASFEKAFERGFVDSDLKPIPSPAERASMAGAILTATGIRARLGVPADELRTFTKSMIPVICR